MWKVSTLLWKINLLKEQIEKLEKFKKFSKEEILKDEMKLSALERDLYVLADLIIQICENINSIKKHWYWLEYRESMKITLWYINFNQEHFNDFLNLSGFRNVLAHEYAKIDYEILFDVLENKISQIENFIDKVEKIEF